MNSFIALVGGIGLILFAIRFLRKGIAKLFGGRLIRWLTTLTLHPWKAMLAGVAAGVVSPSSTSISVMAMQFLDEGRLKKEGVLAMILGANVGMTVLAQLMVINTRDYLGVLIGFGVWAFIYAHREAIRGAGQCVLALGFMFLAIHMMGDGASGFVAADDVRAAFSLLSGHSVLLFVATALLTVILQSSTASVGLGLALCTSSLLGGQEMIVWVLGTNAGVGLSSLVIGWKKLPARRLGLANVMTKLIFAVPLLILPVVAGDLFATMPGALEQKVVMFHSAFNLFVALVSLPLLGLIMRLADWMLPSDSLSAEDGDYLDESALEVPSLALLRATRETLRLVDTTRTQFDSFWQACRTGDVSLARRVQIGDDAIDESYRKIISYLSRIRGEKSETDARWQLALMSFASELEAIGDLLEKHLCDLVAKQHSDSVRMSDEDWQALEDVYNKLRERFDLLINVLMLRDESMARLLAEGKQVFNDSCYALQRERYARISHGECQSLEGNTYFLDYLGGLRRINGHISMIGYAFDDKRRSAFSEAKTSE